jgi:hypothetical protein
MQTIPGSPGPIVVNGRSGRLFVTTPDWPMAGMRPGGREIAIHERLAGTNQAANLSPYRAPLTMDALPVLSAGAVAV